MTDLYTTCDTPRKVRLLGELGRRFGKLHELFVETPAEAIRALCVIRPGFLEYMAEGDGAKMPFRVIVGDADMIDHGSELHMRHGMDSEFIIAPAISGGKSAWASIIIGGLLIAGAVMTGPAGWGALSATSTAAIGTATAWAAFAAASVGALMVLRGASSLLTPTPDAPDAGNQQEGKASYLFNGPVNTTKQGMPVPVGYGRLIIGSAVISAGVTVDDVS